MADLVGAVRNLADALHDAHQARSENSHSSIAAALDELSWAAQTVLDNWDNC